VFDNVLFDCSPSSKCVSNGKYSGSKGLLYSGTICRKPVCSQMKDEEVDEQNSAVKKVKSGKLSKLIDVLTSSDKGKLVVQVNMLLLLVRVVREMLL